MKWQTKPVLAAVLILAAAAALAQEIQVKSAVQEPDIRKTTNNTRVMISLNPNQACTLNVIPFGALGGYSVSYWDSVKQGSNKDTIILQLKLQGANYNTASAFSSYGFSDSIAFQDTCVSHNAGLYCPRVYDMTSYIPRVNYLRPIITNLGPDTCRGFRIFQFLNLDF